jgi:hypothetical protein
MKMAIVSAAAVLLVASSQGVLAVPAPSGKARGKEAAALEKKLLGSWKGQEPVCAGNMLFRADGTYEWTEFGPGGDNSTGTWKVRWDALPPTLVLTRRTSEEPEEDGKITELKLIRLDDTNLALEEANRAVLRYARGKK